MSKSLYAFIIPIAIAVILNSLVLGMLASQSFNQNTKNLPTIVSPSTKVLNNTISSPTPSMTDPAPSTLPYSISIPSPSVSPTTEKIAITDLEVNTTTGKISFSILNNGFSEITITEIYLDNRPIDLENKLTLPTNCKRTLALTLTQGISPGNTYQIILKSSEGYSSTYCIIVA